jgi:hypothetical protein
MTFNRKLATVSVLSLLSLSGAVAQPVGYPRFCVVPVQNGTPTEKDVNQAFRMVSNIVMLPGVPRPVIYALNRRGVWTIDETRAFVPFGGEFPSNMIMDQFVRDPDTARIVGGNAFDGIFALDPGEVHFKKLYAAKGELLRHLYSLRFIPRFNGFVIVDASGLYLLDRHSRLSPLAVSDREILGTPYYVFDLPAFGALLMNVGDRYAAVRFDDGEIVKVATFDRSDSVIDVRVDADGTLSLRGMRGGTYAVRLNRAPVGPIMQAERYDIERLRLVSRRDRLDARSIGKMLHMHALSGVFEVVGDGRQPLLLPFDPRQEPIEALAEMPESKIVLIFTASSIYSLDSDGMVTEIPGARHVGNTPLDRAKGLIPIRNEMILLGANALFLVLDSKFAGEDACRPPG